MNIPADPTADRRVLVDSDQIEAQLRQQFGATLGEMEAIAVAIYRAFVQVSALHPKGFNGTSGWAEGCANLRAVMIPKGWLPMDPQNQPRVVSKNLKVAITVSSGTAHTGVADQIPQTRNDKGAQTANSVNFNARQGLLFPGPVASRDATWHVSGGQSLWMFLYYIDFENRELRYELSQPTSMSDTDKVNDWSMRYIFPSLRFSAEADEQESFDTPDIDIEVTPKAL